MTLVEREIPQAPSPHRWTVDELFRAADAGLFDSQRVELIDGEMIDMPAQNDPHAWAISQLVCQLGRLFPDPYWVKIQATLRLNDHSGPEPDIALMSGPPSPPAADPPSPLLVVEVSETTLHYDRGDKASLYAANGIADYWVADVVAKRVEVFRDAARDPSHRHGWRYRNVALFQPGSIVWPLSKPEAGIEVSAFLS